MALKDDIKQLEQLIDQDKLKEARVIVDKLCEGKPKPPAEILLLKAKICLRSKQYDECLDAAANASSQGNDINNRDWISQGTKLMAFAFYRQGNMPSAAQYIYLADNYNDTNDAEVKIFRNMISHKLGIDNDEDHFSGKMELSQMIDLGRNADKKVEAPKANATKPQTQTPKPAPTKTTSAPAPKPATSPVPAKSEATKQNLRTDWFDSGSTVEISIYVKKIKADSVQSTIKSNSIDFKFKDADDFEYEYKVDILYASIDESTTTFKVFGTKLQILLAKKESKSWSKLESTDAGEVNGDIVQCSIPKDESSSGVAYSSITKKDWSKIKFDDDEDEKEEEEAQDPEGFFKKLYENAGDDARRAMMKSFLESNGTSLSTDWNDVGSREVKPYVDEKDGDDK